MFMTCNFLYYLHHVSKHPVLLYQTFLSLQITYHLPACFFNPASETFFDTVITGCPLRELHRQLKEVLTPCSNIKKGEGVGGLILWFMAPVRKVSTMSCLASCSHKHVAQKCDWSGKEKNILPTQLDVSVECSIKFSSYISPHFFFVFFQQLLASVITFCLYVP